jgi:acyl-CoA thioester hydrolase
VKKITFTISIDSSHIDYGGHVNNRYYFDWMEIGRAKLYKQAGFSFEEVIPKSDVVPAMTSAHIDFIQPLRLGDSVIIEGWITDMKRVSAVMQFRFYRETSLVASGYQKGTWVDRKTGKLVRVPKEIRDRFLPFLENAS